MPEATQVGLILEYKQGELMVIEVHLRALWQSLPTGLQSDLVDRLYRDVVEARINHDRPIAEIQEP